VKAAIYSKSGKVCSVRIAVIWAHISLHRAWQSGSLAAPQQISAWFVERLRPSEILGADFLAPARLPINRI